MASLIVAGDTSGTVTLQAPAIAGSTVLTLPTTSGTLVTTAGGSTVPFALGSAAAPSITFTGDTNTGIFSPGADTIAFSEGGTEVMRIDSAGNVGLGATPNSWGSFWKVIEAEPASGVVLSSKNVNPAMLTSNLYQINSGFATVYSTTGAASRYDCGGGAHTFLTAPSGTAGATATMTERLRINNTGALVLSGGNTTANGVGITFPASQSASSDANTLDDYEEGTWTPSITGRSFTTALGTYVKVGRVCTVTITLNTLNAAVSGNISINGLPFAGQTGTSLYGANSVPFTEVGGVSFGTLSVGGAAFLMYGRVGQGESTVQLLQTNGQIHDAFTAGGGLQTAATLRTSFSYTTSS